MTVTMTQRQLQVLQHVLVEGASRGQIDVLARQLLVTADETDLVAQAYACMALAGPADDDMTTPADERLLWAKSAEQIARMAVRAGDKEAGLPLLTRAYLLHGDILRDMADYAGARARGHEAHAASTIAAGGNELRVRIQLVRGRIEMSASPDAGGSLEKAAEYFEWSYDHLADQDLESMTPAQLNLWAIVLCHHAFAQYLVGNTHTADEMLWKFRAVDVVYRQIRRAAAELGPVLWGNRPPGQAMTPAQFSEFMLRELYHP